MAAIASSVASLVPPAMPSRRPLFVLLCLCLPLSAAWAAPVSGVIALTPASSQKKAGQVVMTLLGRYHLNPRVLDGALSGQVFDGLIESLDPQRSIFTAADVKRLSTVRNVIGERLADGDIAPLMSPVNEYLNRLVEEADFDVAALGTPPDFSTHETFPVDRKSAPRPRSLTELHALWAIRVKDDWLRLKLAGRADDAIRSTLRHRYETMAARARKTTSDDAFQWLLEAYAQAMDPHTDYFGPATARQFNTEMSLSLEGIGAYLREHDEYTQVTELVPGGPAVSSGRLNVGDRITAVGQGTSGPMVDVTGWRTDDVVTLIRGKSGSTVRIEVLPDEGRGDAAGHLVSLVRKHVSIEDQAVQASVIDIGAGAAPHRIGVLSVPSFYEDFEAKRNGGNYRSVSKDVADHIKVFRDQKVDGIVLDLRDNGGGSLGEAVALGGLFCGAGPVVQVKDAKGRIDVQKADGPALWSGPLVVMVNRASASASEILAADLQDRGRAVVVGERTFGKGTVQTLVDLDDVAHAEGLGELKMTIAQFYRINGATTQLSGVRPDIAFPQTYAETEFGESTYRNALPSSSVPPAEFRKAPRLANIEATLQKEHDLRVGKDAAWEVAVERLTACRKMADRSTVSLNLVERKAAREADMRDMEALHRRERALAHPGQRDDDTVTADDGLTPLERPVGPARTKAGRHDDPFLHEAAAMAEDEAVLLRSVADGEAFS